MDVNFQFFQCVRLSYKTVDSYKGKLRAICHTMIHFGEYLYRRPRSPQKLGLNSKYGWMYCQLTFSETGPTTARKFEECRFCSLLFSAKEKFSYRNQKDQIVLVNRKYHFKGTRKGLGNQKMTF